MGDRMREALEAARKELAGLAEIANEDNVHKDYYAKLLQQIDEALNDPDSAFVGMTDDVFKNALDRAENTGYLRGLKEAKAESDATELTYENGFKDGFNSGKTTTETVQFIISTQPYEIYTKVGAETDSKGFVKPNAEVKIQRRLEDADEISELIHADLSLGVDECMTAINEVMKRAGGRA